MKRMRAPRRLPVALLVALGGWVASSCAPSGFQSAPLVNSVRILASRADNDQSYAKPGSTVKLEVLAYDGRATKAAPMTLYWIPLVCENPPNDAYYACLRQLAAGGGAQPGVDLSSLPTGTSFQFTMPSNAVTAHHTALGAPVPYGLAILFNVACAGHLEIVPVDPQNVQAPPVGCFDAQHHSLGPSDYVLGVTRVYAYDESPQACANLGLPPGCLHNANPVIQSIDVGGQTLSINPDGTTPPITTPHCSGNCPNIHIGPVVPPSPGDVNPEERDVNGKQVTKQIWAEFFSTFGSFTDDVRLLYNATPASACPPAGCPAVGAPSDTDDQFQPPGEPGDGFIWIVVHDNRGGAAWVTVPVHIV
jgi:hypothetical protein